MLIEKIFEELKFSLASTAEYEMNMVRAKRPGHQLKFMALAQVAGHCILIRIIRAQSTEPMDRSCQPDGITGCGVARC